MNNDDLSNDEPGNDTEHGGVTPAAATPAQTAPQDRPVAVVTGANKGIGLAVAQALSAAGFRVGIGARNPGRGEEAVRLLRAQGHDVFPLALDVTSQDSVQAAAAAVEREQGRLDVLVNNAGISGLYANGEQDPTTLDLDVVRTVLDTNVFGVVRVTNAFLPLLRRARSPRVINVSSDMGSLALQTGPMLAAYAPSKTMLNALTLQYARALADTPVIVNACCPGYTATDFTGHASKRTPQQAATVVVQLATAPDGSARGMFVNEDGILPW